MLQTKPNVFIIILNWNRAKDTLECLGSVGKIEYSNFHIVVVDNGSTDQSVPVIQEQFPEITIVKNKTNLGFAGGNNTGIEHALNHGADFIFLLNNDTIVDPQIIHAFLQTSHECPEAGIIGAAIYRYSEPDQIWFAGAHYDKWEARTYHFKDRTFDKGLGAGKNLEIDYACGCALFIRAEVIKKIGLLDPRYFNVWEDVDWGFRARENGYQCVLAPSAKVWHKISSSFTGGGEAPHYRYFWWRNRLLFVERHGTVRTKISAYSFIILREIVREMKGFLDWRKHKDSRLKCKAGLAGIRDYFFRRFGEGPSWIRSA